MVALRFEAATLGSRPGELVEPGLPIAITIGTIIFFAILELVGLIKFGPWAMKKPGN